MLIDINFFPPQRNGMHNSDHPPPPRKKNYSTLKMSPISMYPNKYTVFTLGEQADINDSDTFTQSPFSRRKPNELSVILLVVKVLVAKFLFVGRGRAMKIYRLFFVPRYP